MKIVPPNLPRPELVQALSYEEFKGALELLLSPYSISSFCVAVSGGADSLALAFLMKVWCEERGYSLGCVTVDHGLRPESHKEAQRVRTWLTARGIEHHILSWVPPEGKVPHEKARQARYDLLLTWCREKGRGGLLTAHHQEDQAETLLMRFIQGSGSDGLAGIAPLVRTPETLIIRPLLPFSPGQLQAYLRRLSHPWIEDPSNKKDIYKRTRIRNFLATEGLSSQRLSAIATKMGRLREYWRQEVRGWIEQEALCHPAGFYQVNLASFRRLHPEFQIRLLCFLLAHGGGGAYPPRSESLAYLLNRLLLKGFKRQTLQGCCVSLKGDTLLFSREEKALSAPLEMPKGQWILWDGRFRLRCVREGYCVGALGLSNWESIRDQIDSRWRKEIPFVVRGTLPALYEGNVLASVPSIGFKSEPGRVEICFVSQRDLFDPLFIFP